MPTVLDDIADDLAAAGLIPRGGFVFATNEAAPVGAGDARAVLLVGHGGSSIWPHFSDWRGRQREDTADPLDAWSREIIGAVASRHGARAVSPSDRPYLPFQAWAMRAEGLRSSPLGILMHPEFGLWHAYRGALLFGEGSVAEQLRAVNPMPRVANHLCDACVSKPCQKACPAGAHGAVTFAYQTCLDHVRSSAGELCRTGGCFDRNACPHGAAYRYDAAQQAFHMAAFAGAGP